MLGFEGYIHEKMFSSFCWAAVNSELLRESMHPEGQKWKFNHCVFIVYLSDAIFGRIILSSLISALYIILLVNTYFTFSPNVNSWIVTKLSVVLAMTSRSH